MMTIEELRQRLNLVVSTFVKLEGCRPSADELYRELGREYAPIILEYSGRGVRAAG